ncbi:hypothetical protein Pcinc_002684 [Petrolisthes cinctipes]|uniref:Uncharacterized protein n=1 Tax=Petrolisthes cinctipes TaxID=88211 RepID=A0AAE1GPU9_PETCI|nr:hypothetical protein Pcinc_002684 [Petrolisthes cinctipes]
MEELRKAVLSVLQSLPPELLENACEHLISIGVETVSDLKYVTPDDLPMLRTIQVCKLVDKLKQDSSTPTSQQIPTIDEEEDYQLQPSSSQDHGEKPELDPGEKILKWMKEQPSKNFRKIQEQLVEAKCSMSNGTPEAVAITCAVMSYFSEKEETVYKCVENLYAILH